MRIEKVLSRFGICSRRDAVKLVQQGRVTLDGQMIKELPALVTDSSAVAVDGVPLGKRPERLRLWMHYKQRGTEVTSVVSPPPQARIGQRSGSSTRPKTRRPATAAVPLIPLLISQLGLPHGHLIPVGRLDVASEGLLLLTNDGDVARRLELAESGVDREYEVRCHGKLDQSKVEWLARGPRINGWKYLPMVVEAPSKRSHKGSHKRSPDGLSTNQWVTVRLKEGKNRQIRSVFDALHIDVSRLLRVRHGPFVLPSSMKPGQTREIRDPHLLLTTQRQHVVNDIGESS